MKDCRYLFCPVCNKRIASKEKHVPGRTIPCPTCNKGTVWCWVAGNNSRFRLVTVNTNVKRGLLRECSQCKFRFICITSDWQDVYGYFQCGDGSKLAGIRVWQRG